MRDIATLPQRRRIGLVRSLPLAGWLLASVAGAADPAGLTVGPVEPLAVESGLYFERQAWTLEATRGWIWRVRLPRQSPFRVMARDTVTAFESFLPDDTGPWAVINGGFYDVDGNAMGLVVEDGVEHSRFRRGGGSGVLELSSDGPRIIHHSAYRPGSRQALQSIDRIVADRVPLVNRRPDARIAARAAIALSESEIILLLAAQDESVLGSGEQLRLHFASGLGLPLWALAEYIATQTDARDALNLDGSVSAQLAVRVNGRDYRIRATRGTINALVVRP